MPVSFEIIPIPIGSQYVQSIGSNDPDDLNDFDVYILADENVELEQSDLSVSSGSSIVAFEGQNAVHKVTVRPPETAGTVTLTIAQNAVPQGNPQTSKTIRVSTYFPDDDAEVPSTLFSHSYTAHGIAVTPTEIILSTGDTLASKSIGSSTVTLYFLSHDGTELRTVSRDSTRSGFLDYFNNSLIIHTTADNFGRSYSLPDLSLRGQFGANILLHTSLGFLSNTLRYTTSTATRVTSRDFTLTPYDGSGTQDLTRSVGFFTAAYQGGLLFSMNPSRVPNTRYGSVNFQRSHATFDLLEIPDADNITRHGQLNILADGENYDCAIYGNTLYILSDDSVDTLDIRKYRPLAQNTKSRIDVQFATEGDTIDLTQFCPDAERIVFDVGFDRSPSFLSINSSNRLAVGSVQNDTTVLVKLRGINRIDSESFAFYLVILKARDPVWRDVSELTMAAGSRYDLFQLVDADSIAFRSGRSRLAGSSLSNGIFTVGTVGGVSHFTARKGSRSSHIEIQMDVIQASDPSNFSDIFRHRVEIAGIDVTADVKEFPSVTKSLDIDTLNEYLVNEISLTLRSNDQNGFKYNSGISGNFWESNNLNPGGFQASVKVYIESLVDGSWVSSLLFSGIILEPKASIPNAEITLVGVDISSQLENARVQNFGTLEKWDTFRQQSDEATYERVYVPEASLLSIQPETITAWADRTKLTLSRLQLPSEGTVPEHTAHATPSDLRLPSGYLGELPVANFKSAHRAEDVLFLIQQLALTSSVYNTEIDIPDVHVEKPFILNHGSIAFSVEKTRTTRLPVDWVHDPTNNRLLILLSNPEAHIADQLVQYNINSDSYRVLHTFDKDTAVHRIERRNATNYYILASSKIAQDRSARQLLRQTDATGYAYDSLAEGSKIKIYHYNASTNTLMGHVAENNARPPQLCIHYWVGFENPLYADEFEGIVPSPYSAFKVYNSHLYYRYATSSEFGVARVNSGGTTEEMIDQAKGEYWNHVNFAFDLNTSGNIFFVYATGDADDSSLIIKRRTSGGTESTILTDTKALAALTDLDGLGGAYLGAHECLFHNNSLYILAPIQRLLLQNDVRNALAPDFIITAEDTGMSGERFVTTNTGLNGVTEVNPGDDIPIRIDFNGSVSGAIQSDLTVKGGTIQSFSISSDMIDVTIRPDTTTHHGRVIINLAQNAVTQRNEATRITLDFGTRRSQAKSAGCVLYRCNVTAETPTLEVVDKWDFVQLGACNLVVHDGNVHFVEHPPAATKFKPINPDLDGYWSDEAQTQTLSYNLVPESLGALKRINSNGTVESLGNLWFEERPYNIAATRCLSFNDGLHVVMGYGNPDELLRHNSLASQADNFQHLVYGQRLRYVLPNFAPSDSVYASLADIARKVNATLSIQDNIISVQDRSHHHAMTDGATGTGTGNLAFDSVNKSFPASGYLLMGSEILQYTGVTGSVFTGITRGVLGTAIADHADDTPILYLGKVLNQDRVSGNFSELQDTNRIYNVIRDPDNNLEERDPDSINTFGERPYTLNLGLTRHETTWQAHMFAEYLAALKDPHLLINLTLRPSFYLELGDIVGFRYVDLIYAMQIVSITYNGESTVIRGRTI